MLQSRKRKKKNEAYGILNWTWTTRILKMYKDLVKNPERQLDTIGMMKFGWCFF